MFFINNIKDFFKKENNNMKFENIAYEWIEHKRNSVKESIYYNYMFIIDKYLNKNIEEICCFNETV